jgi:hypothetical protein
MISSIKYQPKKSKPLNKTTEHGCITKMQQQAFESMAHRLSNVYAISFNQAECARA